MSLDPHAKSGARVRRNWASTTKGGATSSVQIAPPLVYGGTGITVQTGGGLGVASNTLKITALTTAGDLMVYTTSAVRLPIGTTGQILTADTTLAQKMAWKTPASPRVGETTLIMGTKTITDASVTASTKIFLSRQAVGGVAGNLSYTRNAGVGFTINSDNIADTSVVDYLLIEP